MAIRIAIILAVVISAVVSLPNLSKIDVINSIQDSWTARFTELSGKSFEYKKRLCGVLIQESRVTLPIKKDIESSNDIPATFDARVQWPNCPSINSIKNQGNCGSCWAVGAASAVSDRLCIATNGGVKLNISAENLMTCCSECVDTEGCDGGYPDKAWDYIQSTGLVTGGDYDSDEGCQPYEIAPSSSDYTPACQTTCTNKKYGRPYNEDLHFDKSSYILQSKNVTAMQREILQYGPVEATFDVYDDFYDYSSGVYQHTSFLQLGRHAVRVLGWGTEGGKDYWLVANSWGRGWGEDGLFKILRGTNECRFEEYVLAGQIKN